MRKLFWKTSVLSIAILLCGFNVVIAQKQDRIWLFSDSAGIDFNDLSNPVAIRSNISDPCLTNFTSIANGQGDLLYYTSAVELSLNAV